MRVGVIVNPSSGNFERVKGEIKILHELFEDIYTGCGKFGGDLIPFSKIIEVDGSNLHDMLIDLTLKLSKLVDLLVVVGGDGTANVVATALLDNSLDIPIMGIAGGTANVGPLVRFRFDELKEPKKMEKVKPIVVFMEDEKLGYAFVDLVLGDTFLGTVDGKMVNLSAKDFLDFGETVVKRPNADIREVRMKKNGMRIDVKLEKIAQIVVSPLNHSRFYVGKAITGALCWSYFFNASWAICLSDRIIVDSNVNVEDLNDSITLEQLLFTDDDELEMEVKGRDLFIILDGNPVRRCDSPLIIKSSRRCLRVFSRMVDGCFPTLEL